MIEQLSTLFMRPTDAPPVVMLPIEIKARELFGRTLAALHAVEKGHVAVVGGQYAINRLAPCLPCGIYVAKDVSSLRPQQFEALKSNGHAVVAWDEEGAIEFDYNRYNDIRIEPKALTFVDRFFAWGKLQAEAVRNHNPQDAGKVVEVGNPRLDVLRPQFRAVFESEARAYLQKHGRIILINSSFAGCNPFSGDMARTVDTMLRLGMRPESERAYYLERFEYLDKVFRKFLEMVPLLARRFPTHTIVIRPHPSENKDAWLTAAGDAPNVKVIYEGSANGWSCAAEAVLHHCCTTGLEAMLLDRPTFAYCPLPPDGPNIAVANAGSIEVEQVEQLLDRVEEVVQAKSPYVRPELPALFHDFFSGVGGPLACERIVDALAQIRPAPRTGAQRAARMSAILARQRLRETRYWTALRQGIAGRTTAAAAGSTAAQYRAHKNPGTTIGELSDTLSLLGKQSGRFSVSARQIIDDAFIIGQSK